MFFKRKLSVSAYCTTRLDLLLGQEQANIWRTLKQSWPDPAITLVDEGSYLDRMRAAHVELLLIVITKEMSLRRPFMLLSREARACTEDYSR